MKKKGNYRIIKNECPNGNIYYEVQKKILGLFWWNFEILSSHTAGIYGTIEEAEIAIKMDMGKLRKKTIINVDDNGKAFG